ncbi:hypothetical protein [Laspinema olomoucense]|nr:MULTISPECIES: hypothetical protein [unclassified Laspinema]
MFVQGINVEEAGLEQDCDRPTPDSRNLGRFSPKMLRDRIS